jgi:hypothetical protein
MRAAVILTGQGVGNGIGHLKRRRNRVMEKHIILEIFSDYV